MEEKAMSGLEFLAKWAPQDEATRKELCADFGSVCGDIARRHDRNAVKNERRRIREAIDQLFADCTPMASGVREIHVEKEALLESIFPLTPPPPITATKNWEDVTL